MLQSRSWKPDPTGEGESKGEGQLQNIYTLHWLVHLFDPFCSTIYLYPGLRKFLSLSHLCSQFIELSFTRIQVYFCICQVWVTLICCFLLFYFNKRLAVKLGCDLPFSRPKHACLQIFFKISILCQARHLTTWQRKESKTKGLFSIGTLVTHLTLFWFWFVSLKLLLRYKSYLKNFKTIC